MNVLVTGANGFIGTHTVRRLLDDGHTVRGLVRAGADDGNVTLLREWGCEVVEGDFENASEADRALQGIEGVVHLIGSIKKPRRSTFLKMHRAKTHGLVLAAKRAGVKRIVYISAPGASRTAKSAYLRTKHQAEEAIRASGIDWVVLRVSLVVGRRVGVRDSKLMRRLFDLATTKRKMPVLGPGTNTLQPLHVVNLTEIISLALTKDDVKNRVIGVAGPEVLTMNEIAEGVLIRASQQDKKLKHLPMPLVHVLARLMPMVMKDPPIEKAQVQAMQETGKVDFGEMIRAFPIRMIRFSEALQDY